MMENEQWTKMLLATTAGVLLCVMPGFSIAQCTKDTDCKGSRICEDGLCVEPGNGGLSGNVNVNNNVNLSVHVDAYGRVQSSEDGRPAPTPVWEGTMETYPGGDTGKIWLNSSDLPKLHKCYEDGPSDQIGIIGHGKGATMLPSLCRGEFGSQTQLFSFTGNPRLDNEFVGKPILQNFSGYKFVLTITRVNPVANCWTDVIGGTPCMNAQVRILVFDQNVTIFTN